MNKDISTIRGTTYSFNFIVDEEIDKAYFSCKRTMDKDDTDYLFQKTLNNGISLVDHTEEGYVYVVRVAPEDTNELDAGKYFYDLKIKINGDVIPPLIGKFKIINDVTREVL